MKRLTFVLLILLTSFSLLFSQYRAANWTFAKENGISFVGDSIKAFTSKCGYRIHANNDSNIYALPFQITQACISDEKGVLQFYLDAMDTFPSPNFTSTSVFFNNQHQKIQFSDTLRANPFAESAIIIPQAHKNKYWVFTIDFGRYGEKGMFFQPYQSDPRIYFHEVDMNANNGLGKVVSVNKMLIDRDIVSRITAVKHANGSDWWLISHERGSNRFLIWYIDVRKGIRFHSQQAIGSVNRGIISDPQIIIDYYGDFTVSKDGTKIAYNTRSGLIEMFKFDNCQGILSNQRIIQPLPNYRPSAQENGIICFSPDGNKLYYSSFDTITQFYLNQDSIHKQIIYTINPDNTPKWQGHVFYNIRLGINNKLYISTFSGSSSIGNMPYLSIIHYPDSLGSACGFELEGYNTTQYTGLPNMPNYNLGSALPVAHAGRGDSVCRGQRVRLGSPPVRSGLVFRWSPAQGLDDSMSAQPYATPDSTTVYRLTVTDTTLSASCNVAVDDVTVEVLRARASASVYTLDLSKDSTVQFYNDSEGATRAEWDFGNNTHSTDYYPLPVRYQKRGVYRVKLTAYGKNDCSDSAFVTINVVGIPKSRAEVSESHFSLYPNPTDDRVYYRFPSEKYPTLTAEIYSLTGLKLKSETLTGNDASFSVQELPEGIYICKIISPSGAVVKTGKVGVVK